MKLISIIVPCYNQAQFLEECLQSIIEQTYKNWECIIINDGSCDDTESIAKKWTQKDSRFKYLYKENGGLSSARNLGIKKAQGEWILPLDADDKIGNKYLEFAEKEFYNSNLVYCKARFFGTVNKDWNLPSYNFKNLLLSNHIFNPSFFKKEDWKKAEGYDTNMMYGLEDWEFWINILKDKKTRVTQLNYLGYYYRQRENSMSSNLNNDTNKKEQMKQYIYEKHKAVYLDNFGSFIKIGSKKINLKIILQRIKMKLRLH